VAVDESLLDLAKRQVAHEFGLSPEQGNRLHGDDVAALRSDAKVMRTELGLEPLDERERDEHGRFKRGEVDMNAVIRSAAGR
jgi:hypothetical protein